MHCCCCYCSYPIKVHLGLFSSSSSVFELLSHRGCILPDPVLAYIWKLLLILSTLCSARPSLFPPPAQSAYLLLSDRSVCTYTPTNPRVGKRAWREGLSLYLSALEGREEEEGPIAIGNSNTPYTIYKGFPRAPARPKPLLKDRRESLLLSLSQTPLSCCCLHGIVMSLLPLFVKATLFCPVNAALSFLPFNRLLRRGCDEEEEKVKPYIYDYCRVALPSSSSFP